MLTTRTALCLTILFTVTLLHTTSADVSPDGRNRVLFQHSFKPPFFFVRTSSIPFWDFGGNAIATQEYVRLTNTEQSQVGKIWNKVPLQTDAWEVTLQFKVGGGGQSYGADGFAFWYTKEIRKEGEVYGMTDRFEGLMIAFDTFDNDNLGNNPRILAATTLPSGVKYDNAGDGKAHELGGCVSYFRNLEHPSTVKIIYQQKVLEVLVDVPNTGEFKKCIHVDNIDLPTGYHLGVTAATGGLADNHDVISLVTRDLNPWQNRNNQERRVPREQVIQQQQEELKTTATDEGSQNQESDEASDEAHDPIKNIQMIKEMNKLKHKHNRERAVKNTQEMKEKHAEELAKTKERFEQMKEASSTTSGYDEDGDNDETMNELEESGNSASPGMMKNLLKALTSLHKLQENFAGELEHIHESIEKNNVVSHVKELQAQTASIKGHLFENTDVLKEVSQLAKDMQQLRTELLGLKKIMSDQIKRGNQDVAYRVNQLGTEVTNIKKAVEHAHHGQQEIVRNLDSSIGGLHDTVQKGTSTSFWVWLVLFQIAVFVGVWFYIKYRRERQKLF